MGETLADSGRTPLKSGAKNVTQLRPLAQDL